jgi:hypothetical protein
MTFWSLPRFHPSVLIVIPLLVPAIIVGCVHPTSEVSNIVLGVIPLVLYVLRNVLNFLHLPASPSGRILGQVLNVIDSIVKAIVYTIIKVFDTANLLSGPSSSVFGEVGYVVAVLVHAVLDAVLVALQVVL